MKIFTLVQMIALYIGGENETRTSCGTCHQPRWRTSETLTSCPLCTCEAQILCCLCCVLSIASSRATFLGTPIVNGSMYS